jgi:cell division septum initiation protein DivIVA
LIVSQEVQDRSNNPTPEVIGAAEQRAARIEAEAEEKAAAIIAKAQDRAVQIVSDAQDTARMLEETTRAAFSKDIDESAGV